MAVIAIPVGCDVVALVENDKKTGVISRKYGDVKPSASHADLYDVIYGDTGLMKLQTRAVKRVQRMDVFELELD